MSEQMDEQTVKARIEKGIQNLFEKQPEIFGLTSESRQTEWNLTYHLAHEIHALYPEFEIDLDIKKPNAGNRRPDIVFHHRRIHTKNFLVIELKRNDQKAMQRDLEKIETYWFAKPYVYQFGAAINLNADLSFEVEVRTNPNNPKNKSAKG